MEQGISLGPLFPPDLGCCTVHILLKQGTGLQVFQLLEVQYSESMAVIDHTLHTQPHSQQALPLEGTQLFYVGFMGPNPKSKSSSGSRLSLVTRQEAVLYTFWAPGLPSPISSSHCAYEDATGRPPKGP